MNRSTPPTRARRAATRRTSRSRYVARLAVCLAACLAACLTAGAAGAQQRPTTTAGSATRAAGAVGPVGERVTTATTAAPRVRELKCRGHPAGFDLTVTRSPSPRNGYYVEMLLRYRRSGTTPGVDWLALEPGTCSWNDATGPVEPGYVYFDTHPAPKATKEMQHGSAADASPNDAEHIADVDNIPVYLRDPSHYWTFYVADTGRQVAISDGAWKPSIAQRVAGRGVAAAPLPTTATPDRLGTSRLGDEDARRTTADTPEALRLRDVVVTPRLTGVAVRFSAAASAAPTVRVGTTPPTRNQTTGRWELARPITLPVGGTTGPGAYSAATGGLTPKTRYYFLIDVPGDGAAVPRQQQTGEFTTLARAVTVRFTKLTVIDDSDALSDGELRFSFTANPGEPNAADASLPEVQNQWYDWGDGTTHTLGVTLTVADAGDRLRLLVYGIDADNVSNGIGPDAPTSYDVSGGSSRKADWNVAKGEFDLRSDLEQFRIPFTLRTGGGSKLAFEVTGLIEVSAR